MKIGTPRRLSAVKPHLLLALALGLVASLHADDWPQWRGPDRSNCSRETGLLREWPPEGPPLSWKVTGLGEGITALAVAGGQAYTLGYPEDAEFLFALDALTGETRWVASVGGVGERKGGTFNSLMRWLSPRVPTVDADRIYTITAAGELTCLRTADGGIVWRKRYPNDFLSQPRPWGFCDYPLVDGENLVCVPGGPGATVVALNKRTGDVVWKAAVPGGEHGSYAAPMVSTAHGRRHYVVFLNNGLAGLDARDGRLLWRYERKASYAATSYTPLVRDDLVFAANGYNWGMALLKFVPESDGLAVVEQFHRKFNFSPFQDNNLLVGDHVYAVQGAGQLVCLELQTGTTVWQQESGEKQRRVATTWADGHLYVRRSDGSVTLVEATPREYVRKGAFQIPEPEEVSGVTAPVIANGRLYLRDNRRVLCYDVRADALAQPRPEPRSLEVVFNAAHAPALSRPTGEGAPATTGVGEGLQPSLPAPSATGVNRAPDAIYVPTPGDIVEKMLELADLHTNRVLYDLGSGDGRIVIAAARKYGCRAIGYEIDPRLVEQSRESVRTNGLDHLVRIEHADLFTVDLSGADVVAVYLPSGLLERLRPQLDQLKPGARIVSHQFAIPGVRSEPPLDLVSTEDGDRHRIYHYTLPLSANTPNRGPR